ncbi:ubiquinone-dependent pyruvate dehydrogenase [Hymenobacter sp. BT175]|uniref:ubiquinone-dependent pyruvate dehydrogenase n=1 Tax=Hymenobacter translucens TaxID=2886507 RepID=UPI001D0EDCAF|nr:ubiquinone-dependent pyruvate dehydrogenase [Hymenobacter translucens]MCC2546950.1 ubiquinone-dependent pyruvate dehydrogenase [Hymenobacter translucens]
MAKTTIAELLVDTLQLARVKHIYGVAGDSLNPITDTLRTREGIEWLPMRHEETGALAAGAEAHLTGNLTVCAGSCGPGNLHLINGLYDCHRSRVPVLAIAAQIPVGEIGGNYFQETHPELYFQECSHFCQVISSPEQMPRILEIAIQTALTKRGVAVVIISGDVMKMEVDKVEPKIPALRGFSRLRPQDADLQDAAGLLNSAGKVTIFGGAGCADAHTELLELAEALKAPIVHALRGKEFIEPNNPYDVGLTGLLGFASGYHAIRECDVLLLLGTDFPYRQFYPEDAKVIQVDVRAENLGRRTHVDLGLAGDVGETLRGLLPLLDVKQDRDFLDKALDHYKTSRENLDDMATGTPGKPNIHPQYLTRLLSDLATEDAIFTCDVGTPTVWAARYLKMNGKRRLLGSFNHGTMANAMPQAIGAQLAYPGRQVISMSGDGGFAMLMGDFLTLKQLNVPVKIVIYNNSALGFVELEMKEAGLVSYGTSLTNPNFAELATGCGVKSFRIEDPADLSAQLAEALAYDGPALIDVVVNPLELSMPPTIEVKQAAGFSLYALKAVMSGRGDEVLELAASNLLR